jgi:HTH-type transcriptional regulator, competence development regulator
VKLVSEFGEYIRSLRKKKDITINQLSLYSGISASQLSRIESGKRGIPKPPTIEKLANALKVDYAELMEKAGYIDEITPEFITEVNGEKIKLTQQEFEILNELKKHAIAFENLKSNPEKKVKQMIKSWNTMQEALKEIDDDDSGYLE